MLNWANRFNIFCLLDNADHDKGSPSFKCLLAAGSAHHIEANAGSAFMELEQFYTAHHKDWLFGHLGYDLKNELAQLNSSNGDGIRFPDLHFFVPLHILELRETGVKIFAEDAADIFKQVCDSVIDHSAASAVQIRNKIEKKDYINIIEKLKAHILRGDCYEINFCQEFYADDASIDPLLIYDRLVQLSPNPFAVLYKLNDRYCLCASPERYLKRSGNRIISQPIKGTAKRDLQNITADEQLRSGLQQSEKERSENVMIVDLVRNDLSRICKAGTVKVDELFGIYSFPQVHQMISTVSGEPEDSISWIDCIKATFPMGSMTGAPKRKVMELIERYEQTKRGLFSGTIGYIRPCEDLRDGQAEFDFNVVIRSMMYNARAKYISFQTGGAITFNSNAEMEYDECLLKAAAMMKVLQ